MSYLNTFLKVEKFEKVISTSSYLINKEFKNFDTIAVRGNSGLLVGAPLALHLKKDLIIVRKDTEKSHSDCMVEGWGINQRILIVDDFIESGNTIDYIYEYVGEKCDSPTFVGIFLYNPPPRYRRTTYTHPDGTEFRVVMCPTL